MDDLEIRRMKNTENVKEIPAARSTKYRVILILGVLLILAFLVVVILTSLLFTYYKSIKEEMTHLKNEGNSSCCPKGWLPIGSNCYYFPKTLETWERSREGCTKNYSILLILKNKNELDSLLPFMEGDRYWIGLQRDTQNSSHWLWIDGAPLTFSAWAEGEPNNENGHENCTEMRKSIRSLNDVPCDIKKHYICKALSRC